MATTNLTIQIDIDLKEKAEILFHDLGLDMTSAINLFIRKSIEENKLPIEVDEDFDWDDPYTEEEETRFYRPSNVAAILEAKKSFEEGKGIEISLDELRAMLK